MVSPGKRRKDASVRSPETRNVAVKWIAGSLGGFVLVAVLFGWWFLRRDEVVEPVVQPAPRPAVPETPTNPAASAAPEPSPPAVTQATKESPPQIAAQRPSLKWIVTQKQDKADEVSPAECDLPVSELAKGVRVLEFPHPVTGAAFDEETGHLALMSEQDGVRVYSIPEELPDRVPALARLLQESPMNSLCRVSIADKPAFAMACRGKRVIRFVDARTLQPLSQVDVPDQGIAACLTTDGRNALYYLRYTTKQEASYTSVQRVAMGRIALDSMTLEDREESETNGFDLKIQAHPNGEVYKMANNHVSRMKWDNAALNPQGWNIPHFGSIVFCPSGQRLFTGRKVWPLSMDQFLESRGQQTNRNIGLLLKSYPVGLSINREGMQWISANDFRELKAVPIPEHWHRDKEPIDPATGPFPRDIAYGEHVDPQFLAMFDDTPRQRAIVVLHRRILVLPWPVAAFPAEPWPVIPPAPIDSAIIGEPITLKIPETPGIDWKFGESTLLSGSDPQLRTWTPQPVNGSRIYVPLVGQSKSGPWKQEWEIPVKWPGVDIPFFIKTARFDSSGRWAVVIGTKRKYDPSPETFRHLALVDVASRRITTQCELPQPVQAAVVDEHGVYALISNNGYQVARLSMDDLSVQSVSNVYPTGGPGNFIRPEEMELIGGKYLVLPFPAVLKVPSLEPDSSWTIRVGEARNYGRIGDQWLMGGIVWDATMTSPQLLWNGNPEDQEPDRIVHAKASGIAASVMGRGAISVFGSDSLDVIGSFEVSNGNAILSSPPGREHLRNGKSIIQPEFLAGVPLMQLDYRYASVAPGLVAFVNESRLLLIPHRHWDVKSPDPVFPAKQSTFTLNLHRPNEVRYHLPGARKYRLVVNSHGVPGTVQESTSGQFDVDLSQIPLQQLVRSRMLRKHDGTFFDLLSLQKELDRVMDERTGPYRLVTGKAPKGLPCLVTATVLAETESGQKAGLLHQYYIELPLDEYRKAYLPQKP